MRLLKCILAILALCAAGSAAAADRLYACGSDQVREYVIDADGAQETWRWTAADATDLPDAYRTQLLAKIDECKPVDGGRSVLMTASTGGVVLIDRETGKVRFRATAPMAHSADLLPGGYLAVALSIHKQGDRLDIYQVTRDEPPLVSVPLPSGHGAVWDARRERLFALSDQWIQAFAVDLRGPAPQLTETARYSLPGRRDGHDLSPTPDGGYVVTTDDGAWRFDVESGQFSAIPALNPKQQVKAVSVSSRAMAWVQAEERWWAHGFTIAASDGTSPRRVETPGMRLYKVRWLP